jgi:hypothetical protein
MFDADAKLYRVLTPAQAKGLWDRYAGQEHPHTACVADFEGKVSDPHAFCASVEKMAAGTTPAERAAEKKHEQLFDLQGVEIFAAGTHNGDTYTEADIDDMVRAFGELDFQPPLKAGHSEDRKGMPALGWIGNLRRIGSKLIADFTGMPALVRDAIKDKRYNTVSSEIYWNLTRGAKKFRRALKAVALLGAEIPAVAGLKPLHEMFDADAEVHNGADVRLFNDGGDMTPEEVKVLLAEAIGPLVKQLGDLTASKQSSDDLSQSISNMQDNEAKRLAKEAMNRAEAAEKALKAEREAREAAEKVNADSSTRITKLEDDARRNKLYSLAETCRIPALRGYVQQFADLATRNNADVKVYDTNGREVSALKQVEDLIKYVNDNAARLFSITSSADVHKPTGASEELARRAKAYQAEAKVPYLDAMRHVANEDPALKEAYARESAA